MLVFTIAVDGPAAAGKGTLSKRLALETGFAYLDTGLLYRATGFKTLQGMSAIDAANSLTPEDFLNPELRSAEVGQAGSIVSAIPEVRALLFNQQREFARQPGGAILDGRDIGTNICPEANVKFFVTASPHARAERRMKELKDTPMTFDDMIADIIARDERDSSRATNPLRPAQDAIILDTSEMSIEEVYATAFAQVQKALQSL
jgi:cytidylate kinase